jgi:pyruvate dehydrogenase E2 component (dihydrolipoamide acetyltransferase)
MASRVVMPKLTETMEEGVLIKWYKKEGEHVESGDTLAEIETDKAVTDLESYASGILKKVLVPPESVVPAGDLIAVVADPDEDVTEMVKKEKPRYRKRGDEEGKKAEPPASGAPVAESAPPQKEAAPEKTEVKASPLAKRLAQERGVDLAGVEGTGPGGRITEKDVERHLQGSPRETPPVQPAAAHLPAIENPFEEIPLSLMRKTIAKRMVQSLAPVPHFYVTTEVEMTEVLRYRESLPEAASGVKITIGDLIVKAAALALRDFPRLRASFMGEKIRVYRRIDIGVAVGFEEGLTTVVIRDCDRKGLKEISLESRDLIQRVRSKALKPEEYTGSVFSVSNLGMYDVDAFTAIITPPEAAALAVGSVTERPRIVNNEIAAGKFLRATLSTDHRVADGLTAAEYLKTFKRILQNPLGLAL